MGMLRLNTIEKSKSDFASTPLEGNQSQQLFSPSSGASFFSDNQLKALRYIIGKVREHAGWQFNPAEIAKVTGITRQGAWKMLNRFATLGILQSGINKKITYAKPLPNGQTHYFVLEFKAVLDTVLSLVSLFIETLGLPTKNLLNISNHVFQSGDFVAKCVQAAYVKSREDLAWSMWVKRKNFFIAEMRKMGGAEKKIREVIKELYQREASAVNAAHALIGNLINRYAKPRTTPSTA